MEGNQVIFLTGVAMANATYKYEFMRENATEEMRRVLGAKAANVQLAVPPALAAGDWSVILRKRGRWRGEQRRFA